MINTPHNPTGKVFTREELEAIAALCVEHDAIAITDEIYEHITYDGARHVPIATLPGMRERTVDDQRAVEDLRGDGLARRLGDRAAGADGGHPSTHDFLTVAAAAPLQMAGVGGARAARRRTTSEIARRVRGAARRDDAGAGRDRVRGEPPQGAYYVMADVSSLGFGDDVAAAR